MLDMSVQHPLFPPPMVVEILVVMHKGVMFSVLRQK